jgi:hypothetical protein
MNVTLQLGKTIGRTVNLADFGFSDGLSPVAIHLATKGLENVVKDTHAGITKKDNPHDFMALSEAAVDKKLAALKAGDLRTVSTRIDVAAAIKSAVTKLTFEEFLATKTDAEKAEFMAQLANMGQPIEKKKKA